MMSYSRSSQNSDIYAYASVDAKTNQGIFYIHPACNRDGKLLDLPFACETIKVNTLQELKDKLLELQELGYRITANTFARIEKELNDKGS
jgi:hypothetical protein